MRGLTGFAFAPLLMVGLAGCDLLGSKNEAEKTEKGGTKVASAASRLCAANATYARLKESAFDEAKRIRERDTEVLDALADASVVRMENPLLESRDEALGLTVCSGRMIVELPPGAGAAFDGRQRLAADITYSAQAAADGSGTVYKIDGGEPIVYRLASFDPRGATRTAAINAEGLDAPAEPVDEAEIIASEPVPPVAVPKPQPRTPPVPAPPPRPALPDPSVERARRLAAAERASAERAAAERATRAASADRAVRAATAERAARVASAERAARAAAAARQERAAAAERRARAERIAAAQRDERGEEVEERPTRTARAAAARPSFNCRYARSRVEKMICSDPDLAARDRRMAGVYYRTSANSDAVVRRRLSASRLRFLAYRDHCGDAECVASAYEDRIDEINDLADQ